MEIEENHRTCKRSRAGNGNHQEEDDDEAEAKGEVNNNNNIARMRPWHHPSSRIFRVSRASGGKDRHSKVYTSKGLRDRRVRLSVSTAIQFYDLQDRLGYDQPSKAIEWLIKASSSAINELPLLDASFAEPLNMEKPPPALMASDPGVDPDNNNQQQQQHSSASETSKGSALSLSRSENRMKARERARERVKDKEKDREDAHVVVSQQQDASLHSQGSFTKLLTGGSCNSGQAAGGSDFIQKQIHSLPPVTSTADYFGAQSTALFGHHQQQNKSLHSILPAFSSQAHYASSSPSIGMVPFSHAGSSGGDHQSAELQPFPFLQDHFFPAATAANNGGDYNLNFSISPGLAGFHRGTLQSNSPSHLHHHQLSHHQHQQHQQQVQVQRLASASMDGPSVPFFFGVPASSASPAENPYSSGFDGHLQLCEGYKQFELKGKGRAEQDQNASLVFFLLQLQ